QKAGRVLIAGDQSPADFECAGGAQKQDGKEGPNFGPELTRPWSVYDRAGIKVEREGNRETHSIRHDRAERGVIHPSLLPFVAAEAEIQHDELLSLKSGSCISAGAGISGVGGDASGTRQFVPSVFLMSLSCSFTNAGAFDESSKLFWSAYCSSRNFLYSGKS